MAYPGSQSRPGQTRPRQLCSGERFQADQLARSSHSLGCLATQVPRPGLDHPPVRPVFQQYPGRPMRCKVILKAGGGETGRLRRARPQLGRGSGGPRSSPSEVSTAVCRLRRRRGILFKDIPLGNAHHLVSAGPCVPVFCMYPGPWPRRQGNGRAAEQHAPRRTHLRELHRPRVGSLSPHLS